MPLTDEEMEEMVGVEEAEEAPETKEETEENVETVEEPETGDEEDPAPPAEDEPPDIAALETRIQELESINHGLLKAKTSSQASKQSIQEAYQREQERVAALEAKIKELNQPAPAEQDKQVPDKIEVQFDDEGNAFIPGDKLPVDHSQAQKVKELESRLLSAKEDLDNIRVQAAQQAELKNFLSENEKYAEVMPQAQEQWSYLKDELFDQFITAKNLPAPESPAQALEIAATPEFQKAFKSKYPDSDPEVIMQAGLTGEKYYQRKALNMLIEQKERTKSSHTPLPTDKPPSLSTVTGASTQSDENTDLQKYADMTMEDFLRMTPEEERRMNDLLKRG